MRKTVPIENIIIGLVSVLGFALDVARLDVGVYYCRSSRSSRILMDIVG